MVGSIGIFIIGTLLACISSGRWLLNGEMNIVNALASINAVSMQGGGGLSAAKQIPEFLSALITALGWNYPYLASPWTLFIKIPLWLVSLGAVIGVVELFMMVIQGLVGVVRSIIP